jgi:ribonuclease HI
MSSPAEEVAALERELLVRSARGDGARLNELLHPQFVEVGASGRRWTRADMIEALVADPDLGALEVDDVVASVVSDDAVLVTYTTRRSTASIHRASLWVRHGESWAVRYHQGTPVAD